jgi:hypothetical protein
MTDMSEPIGDGLHYYVLPKDGDPVAALNILRADAGLGPWREDGQEVGNDGQRKRGEER